MGRTVSTEDLKTALRTNQRRVALGGSLLHRQPGFHPSLLSFWIVCYVRVTHRRQFTGGVFAGVSMGARAVGNDLNILVG